MNRRASLTLACLAASLPLSGKMALADQKPQPAADPAQSQQKATLANPDADQSGPTIDLPQILGQTADPMDTGAGGTGRDAWRADQIRFTSDSGHLIARPWLVAKGDITTWDGNHTNPNYLVEFGVKGSYYHDITYDFAGFVGFNNGLTWREANVGYLGCDIFRQRVSYKAGLYDSIYWKEQGQVHDQNTLFLYRSLFTYTIGSVEYGDLVGGASAYWGDPCGDQPLALGVSVDEIANTQPFTPNLIDANNTLGPHHIGTQVRADWMPWGDRYVTHDLSGRIGRRNTFDLGGGFAYDDQDNANLIRTTVDAQYVSPRRFTTLGVLALNYTKFSSTTNGVGSRTDWGFLLQGGYFFTPQLEGIARYDYTHIDNAFALGGKSHLQEFSVGLNYYPGPVEWRNHVKLQAALNYLPDGTPAVQQLNYTSIVPGQSRVFLQFGGQFSF